MGKRSSFYRFAGLCRQSNGKGHMLRRGTDHRIIMTLRTIALLMIAALVASCCGCITLEKDDDAGTVPDVTEPPWSGSPAPSWEDEEDSPGPGPAHTPSTSPNGNVVVPVDPVPVQSGEPLPEVNPCGVPTIPLSRIDARKTIVEKTTVFEGEYSLVYSARGLQVDVVDVPFIITFSVTPKHSEPGAYSRLVVTVRDPETLRLIADEGYNSIYGSERTKSIKLYQPGRYIVTLDGHFVDVKVKMQTEQARAP